MTAPDGGQAEQSLGGDAVDLLARWVADAEAAGVAGPSTMTLATVGTDGSPHARTVLVTSIGPAGVRFHSSSPTGKTRDLEHEPRCSGVFHWAALGRQVVLAATAALAGDEVSRLAYPTRPIPLQLVAWAYEDLLDGLVAPDYEVAGGAVQAAVDRAAAITGGPVMPAGWTTVDLSPTQLDFWQAGAGATAATRTRFVLDDSGWRSFPVLP